MSNNAVNQSIKGQLQNFLVTPVTLLQHARFGHCSFFSARVPVSGRRARALDAPGGRAMSAIEGKPEKLRSLRGVPRRTQS
jgi:hypothetical protein